MPANWPAFIQALNIPTTAQTLSDNAIYPITALQCLEVAGPEAGKFLQGQLSCDINTINSELSGLGSHNTPKGRMLSSFRIMQCDEHRYWLAIDQSIIDAAEKALGKYIVFSKAETSHTEVITIGLHGKQALANLQSIFPNLPGESYQQSSIEGGFIICTSAEHKSYELYINPQQALALWPKLCDGLAIQSSEQQKLIQHELGLAFVEQASFDAHIPQTFNYQATPALSFTKGCYTGQEIVARMQYLGKLKRHMYHYRLHSTGPLKAGDAVNIADKKQAIGDIISAVETAEHEWDVLMILTDAGAQADALFTAQAQMTQLQKIALPYSIEGLVD